LNKVEISSLKDDVPSLIEIGCWFWRRRFLKTSVFFHCICFYLPLMKRDALHLNKLESFPPKDDLCKVWLRLAQWFWRRT
jgi:hypothetical protein